MFLRLIDCHVNTIFSVSSNNRAKRVMCVRARVCFVRQDERQTRYNC